MLVSSPALAAEILPADLDDPATFGAARVVILGEVHDNPVHHSHQARAVQTLAPKALVFEMLPPMGPVILPDALPAAGDLARTLGWDSNAWPGFSMYYPIFAAAPQARIYGAEVPREIARQAFKDGIAAVFGDDAAAYGLTEALTDDDQAQRQAEQALAHCNALPADLLPGMVDVQRLRDASLARAVVQALNDTGGPVAVITGTGHARTDQGLTVPLARVIPDLAVLSIGQFEDSAPPDAAFDLWLITAATPREDPCLSFTGGN